MPRLALAPPSTHPRASASPAAYRSPIRETGTFRLAILCHESSGRIDAIRTYSTLLAETLARAGARADVFLRTKDGGWVNAAEPDAPRASAARGLAESVRGYDAVLLQYNPFMYGRWGFAPWLPVSLRALGPRSRRPILALMVHEPYVPMVSWRWTLMGLWQRTQLAALRAEADVVFASIEAWTSQLSRWWPLRPTRHLPVASNLPDKRTSRAEERERLGVDTTDTVVLAAFGTGHPARLTSLLVDAANAAAATRGRVLLLNLGAGARTLRGRLEKNVELHEPGNQSEDALARSLAAADVFLIPLVDGVSTRRGSLMAALQHGLAVVGTDGPLTDRVLRDASGALRLVPTGRPEAFARTVARLVDSPDERRELGRAARALYAESFDWPAAGKRVLDDLRLAQWARGRAT